MKKTIRRWGGAVFALVLCIGTAPGTANAFTMHGFGDVTYTATEMGDNGRDNNGFNLGQLDFYVAEQISDRVDVLVEFVIENPGDGFVVDLERLQVGYAVANQHKIRAGRFHNLMGYWNLAFHHGAQLHTSVGRPFFLEFEDDNGIIPVHMVGLWWSSRFETGAGKVDFGLMFGNGAALTGDAANNDTVELDPGSGGDSDNKKAVSANLTFRPSAVRGLEVGASVTAGTIVLSGTPGGIANGEIDQTVYALHAAYLAHNAELLGEFYAWNHDATMASGFDDSSAFYVQAGYLVGERVTPYVRYESLSADGMDPYFQTMGMTMAGTDRDKTIVIAGVRYDLNYRSAVKVEYRSIEDDNYDGSFTEGAVQWSFAF